MLLRVRAAILGSMLVAACGGSPESLNTYWTGDVVGTSPLHYEATGPDVFARALYTRRDETRTREAENVAWHVSPDNGGFFAKTDEGMQFKAGGPGTYEIWVTGAPTVESPRVTLVVPPADQMRSSTASAAPAEAPIRLRIGPGGTTVGVEAGPVDVEVQTSNPPAPSNRGRHK